MTNRELANNAAGAIIREAFGDSERISAHACSFWQGVLAAIIERECFAPAPAEPPEPAPEPERPEPKFQQWQWYEATSTGDTFRCIDRSYSRVCGWNYKGERFGCPKDVLFSAEVGMRPHTMTIDDVPPETMHAILHGKPVQVVKHPVDHKGVPFSEPEPPGTVITIADLTGLNDDDGQPVAYTSDDEMFWPWNLKVAEQPEGGA